VLHGLNIAVICSSSYILNAILTRIELIVIHAVCQPRTSTTIRKRIVVLASDLPFIKLQYGPDKVVSIVSIPSGSDTEQYMLYSNTITHIFY